MDSKRADQKRILIFLAMTFSVSYIYGAVCSFNETEHNIGHYMVLVYMLFPTLCALLTKFLTKEKVLTETELDGNCVKYTVIAWYLIFGIMVLGYAVFFCIHPEQLASSEKILSFKHAAIGRALILPMIGQGLWLLMSEEYGWRGFLLPKLTRTMGVVPATFITGIIWAVWHIPLLVKESPLSATASLLVPSQNWLGYFLLSYIPLCISISMLLSFVSLKAHSAVPAAFLHACYNGVVPELVEIHNANRADAAVFTLDHPWYYCIVLILVVGIPMMIHLRKLEKQGELVD